MGIRFVTILAFILSTLFSAQSLAQGKEKKARWYKVNLTIFKQKPDSKLDESFAANAVELDIPDLIQLKQQQGKSNSQSAINAPLALHHEALGPNSPFVEQSIDEDWIEVLGKLDPAQQPILYNAQWVQPVYDQKNHIPLYFESSLLHLNQPQLRGVMDLHVSRYLHAHFKINYWPENADSFEDLVSFESARRMRSKELHYLDHPLVGVLLRMLPMENPIAAKEKREAERLKAEAAKTKQG